MILYKNGSHTVCVERAFKISKLMNRMFYLKGTSYGVLPSKSQMPCKFVYMYVHNWLEAGFIKSYEKDSSLRDT